MGYGIEAFNERNPLAWPCFATVDDVTGFPPTVISVNECDPLRDEGINFYRLLLQAGVAARCRQVMGTIHGTEIFAIACPDISRDTAPGHRRLRPRLTARSFDVGNDESGGTLAGRAPQRRTHVGRAANHHSAAGSGRRRRSRRPRRARDGTAAASKPPAVIRAAAPGRSRTSW